MTNKNKLFSIILVALSLSVSGCVSRNITTDNNGFVTDNNKPLDTQNLNGHTNDNQEMNIGSEVLETNIDTSDWTEYRSEKFGYRLQLPAQYHFVDEYYGKKIEFDPNNTTFIISSFENNKDNKISHNLYFSIREKDIEEYINEYNEESKQENAIIKLFTKNNIEYYYRAGKYSDKSLVPTILYNNFTIATFSHESEFDNEIFKAVINLFRFDD